MAPQPGIVGFMVLYNQLGYIFHQPFVRVLEKFLGFISTTDWRRQCEIKCFICCNLSIKIVPEKNNGPIPRE